MKKLGRVAILPQYIQSDCMFEKFLNASFDDESVFRTPCIQGETKIIVKDEFLMDRLEYFIVNNNALQEEFCETLRKRLVKESAFKFCKIIRDFWADGRAQRLKSVPVRRLMKSVQNYLIGYRKVQKPENIRTQLSQMLERTEPNFDDDEISEILAINREMTNYHIQKWMEGHPKYDELTTNKIYIRRGLALESDFKTGEYAERYLISSYSLSFSVGEQFAKIIENRIPAIVNMSYGESLNRILFFSPFIPGMKPNQLEFGIIPHYYPLKISFQEEIGGIKEYILGK